MLLVVGTPKCRRKWTVLYEEDDARSALMIMVKALINSGNWVDIWFATRVLPSLIDHWLNTSQ
ncbi:hypothetical protein M8C21_001961 [Ambrosia artemisiifolia]|uniref:Uncharacterized protein n=1 Tax=Ambrosia artemisiifolia TaxID=4212 RepID=A0AAD5GI00_AMBAR|nr:hypothetical protein M8C21_001961 [Ambrosia artemisiifolia]